MPAALHAAVVLLGVACGAVLAAESSAAPTNYAERRIRAFIDEMATERRIRRAGLQRLFAQVRYQPQVIAAISRPVLSPPKWYEFAPRFLAPSA
jgi:membrane-bound lytic murein transglycosylase B